MSSRPIPMIASPRKVTKSAADAKKLRLPAPTRVRRSEACGVCLAPTRSGTARARATSLSTPPGRAERSTSTPRSPAIASSLARNSIKTLSQAPRSRTSKEIFAGRGASLRRRDNSAEERTPLTRIQSPNNLTRSSPAVERFASQPLRAAVPCSFSLRLTAGWVVAAM